MVYKKECGICNIQFKTILKNQKYCSNKCRWKSQKRKVKHKCLNCKKVFEIPYCHSIRGQGKFCSKKCYCNYNRTNFVCKTCGKEKIVPKWRKKARIFCSLKCAYGNRTRDGITLNKTCEHCGKKFYQRPNSLRNHCSMKCRIEGEWNPKREIKNCLNCGNEFIKKESEPITRQFCSLSCYRKYKGESHIERKFRLELDRRKIKYLQEIQVGRYSVDFIVKNIAIEIDGNYWHDKEGIRERDRRKGMLLKLMGYKVVRFTETEINENVRECADKILAL